MVSAYPPTFSPVTRLNEPVKVSEPKSEPAVTEGVNDGSVAPYCFVAAAAVTVIGRCVIVRSAPT